MDYINEIAEQKYLQVNKWEPKQKIISVDKANKTCIIKLFSWKQIKVKPRKYNWVWRNPRELKLYLDNQKDEETKKTTIRSTEEKESSI